MGLYRVIYENGLHGVQENMKHKHHHFPSNCGRVDFSLGRRKMNESGHVSGFVSCCALRYSRIHWEHLHSGQLGRSVQMLNSNPDNRVGLLTPLEINLWLLSGEPLHIVSMETWLQSPNNPLKWWLTRGQDVCALSSPKICWGHKMGTNKSEKVEICQFPLCGVQFSSL